MHQLVFQRPFLCSCTSLNDFFPLISRPKVITQTSRVLHPEPGEEKGVVIPVVALRFQVSQVSTQVILMQRTLQGCFIHVWTGPLSPKVIMNLPTLFPTPETERTSTYHEEEWLAEILQQVDGIGGHRVCPRAPCQGIEPWLIDHIEVGGDVCCGIFPLKDQKATTFIEQED